VSAHQSGSDSGGASSVGRVGHRNIRGRLDRTDSGAHLVRVRRADLDVVVSSACILPTAWPGGIVYSGVAEPVKSGETRWLYALCATSSGAWIGGLIHATVGSFGGCGRRVNRVGFTV
jgi:hypothetical protein